MPEALDKGHEQPSDVGIHLADQDARHCHVPTFAPYGKNRGGG
jgi:hypothetical protein